MHRPIQGRIAGTVTDSAGGLVPGATIVAKNERTGEERTATTNEVGYSLFPHFVLRLYHSVTANAKDFQRRPQTSVVWVQEFTAERRCPTGRPSAATGNVATRWQAVLEPARGIGANVNQREAKVCR